MNVTKEIIANSNDKDLDLIYNCITELNNNYNNGVVKFCVNGNYQELQNVTRKIIEYSNIIIVTLNLNELYVKDSLNDLFNLLKPYKDSIIILITKLDTDLKNRNKKQIYKKEIGEEEIEKIKDCKNKLFKYYDLDIAEERIFGYSSEIELDGRTIHFEKLMNYINQIQQQFEKEIIVNETEIKRLSLNIKNINQTLKDLLKNNTDFKIYNCKNLRNPNELIIYDPITNIETTFQKSIFFATSNSSLHSLINENKTLILKTALSIDHDQPYKREKYYVTQFLVIIMLKFMEKVKEENSCDKRGLLMERYKSNAEVYFIENEQDIKLANYLLDENNNRFLTDFGYSKDIATESNSNSTPLGTLGYIAPEFNYDIQACNDKVDVWSLGIVLYEIACGVRFNRAVTNQEEYKNSYSRNRS
ncbi:hypothetical protein ABK040_012757 [Willaertia magna]